MLWRPKSVDERGVAPPPAPAVLRTDRTVDLEMHRRSIGPDGAADFLWPLAPLHYWPARDAIAGALVTAARNELALQTPASHALRILVHSILLEALAIYVSQRIVGRFREEGLQVIPPARARVLRAIAADAAPPRPALLRFLADGPQRPHRLRAPARLVRDILVQRNIRRRTVATADFQGDIITTTIDPLPEFHAGRVPERVLYRRWHGWFGPQRCTAQHTHRRLATLAVDAIAAGFATAGETIHAASAAGLRSWIADALALIEAHVSAAGKAPLPQRLWTGSGGIIWNRMLQWLVRDAGGEVTAHDHGAGLGHIEPDVFRTIFEYEGADRFATYTVAQADGQRVALQSSLQILAHPVEIFGVDGGLVAPVYRAARRPVDAPPRRVMVLSSYYFGDVITCEGFVPDLSMLDFEARLISQLQGRGYEVIYKPHPLIVTRPPHDMAAQLGADELSQPSEEAIKTVDVVVLVDPLSTAFSTTLASGCPAVLVDFGLSNLTERARSLLLRRAPIVKAGFNAQNRVQIDWDLLVAGIQAATKLRDDSFIDVYYGPRRSR